MRKFRGKRKDNSEWTYGNLLDLGNQCFIIPEITNGSWSKDRLMLKFISPCYEVDPETIGQYTGLHDKNGKEIYEGDVVKIAIEQYGYDGSSKDYRIIKGEIKWSHLGFDIKIGTHDGKPVYSDIIQEMHLTDNIISDEWEVIGNTYDDTEATP